MIEKVVLPFDMSLRFWSEHRFLDDIAGRLGTTFGHLHIKGRPIADRGPAAGRLAKRHYASIAHAKGLTFSEVTGWLWRTAENVESDSALVHLLDAGQVDALFWIAMFGRDPVPTPALEADLVSSVVRLHAQVMIENYTPTCPDYPTKTWFPDRAV